MKSLRHSLGPVTTISGVEFFGSLERRMYLETFSREGKRIRSGKFFYGQKTDVTSENPLHPKFDPKFYNLHIIKYFCAKKSRTVQKMN